MSIKNFGLIYNNLFRFSFGSDGLAYGSLGGGGGPPASTEVAPPTISGEFFVGGTVWSDDGSDNPTTTYTRQWVSGATDTPTTPIAGQTSQSITVPSIAGNYLGCLITPANGQPARLSNVIRIHAAAITAPVITRTSASGASPFTYTVQYDNTVFSDDIEHVQYSSDISFSNATLLWGAIRGMTEERFVSPFLSDDSSDADPSWSTAPPTFTGTYFVRRRIETFDGTQASPWSNVESNVTIDLTVRFNPLDSWQYTSIPADKFTFADNFTTFIAADNTRKHGGRVNYSRSGDRTVELLLNTFGSNPSNDGSIIIGFDDMSKPLSGVGAANVNQQRVDDNGTTRGVFMQIGGNGVGSIQRAAGTGFPSPAGNAAVTFAPGDIIRVRYTPGTFTPGGVDGEGNPLPPVPNNNGIVRVHRIRAGVSTLFAQATGCASMSSYKVMFGGSWAARGTLIADNFSTPVEAGSQEYQDV